ncbi:MAG: hypothetical protein PHN56_03405 [Candidatus Nanoarchaeia archaeon]|nr:hypothetical protein [Candidatus Nanoarchaeia archaeon]
MKLFSVMNIGRPSLEGKLLELNVEIDKIFAKELYDNCLYKIAKILFSNPLYFDSKGNNVEYSSKYKKITVNSILSNNYNNLSSIIYLSNLITIYQKAVTIHKKAVKLGKKNENDKIEIHAENLKGSNQIHLTNIPSDLTKYFNGVINIIPQIPFLSIKKDQNH